MGRGLEFEKLLKEIKLTPVLFLSSGVKAWAGESAVVAALCRHCKVDNILFQSAPFIVSFDLQNHESSC